MTVFKAFLRILARNKMVIFMYSAILIIFSIFSLQSNPSTVTFEAIKPDLYLVNHDSDQGITHALVSYLSDQNNLISLPDTPDAISDALFYRQINFYVEIPAGFREDFLNGKNPALLFRSSGDYNASLAEMRLTRFLDIANQYLAASTATASPTANADTAAASAPVTPVANANAVTTIDEATLIQNLERTLAVETPVELTSSRDATSLDRAAFYYDFMNYPLLVGCIYIISTVMLSFREQKVARRIAMGALTPRHVNRILLGANSLFALALWLLYVVISFVIIGPATMFSLYGLWFAISSFVFALSATALAFLIANLIKNRNVINGITNVIALGSSFLCGAFVPITLLPDFVVAVAHALPAYWYISANNQIATLEAFSFDALRPIVFHLLVVLLFTLVFILLANLLSRRRK